MSTMSEYDTLWNHSVTIILFDFTVSHGRNNNVLLNSLCSGGKCLEIGCITTTFTALKIDPMFGLAGSFLI